MDALDPIGSCTLDATLGKNEQRLAATFLAACAPRGATVSRSLSLALTPLPPSKKQQQHHEDTGLEVAEEDEEDAGLNDTRSEGILTTVQGSGIHLLQAKKAKALRIWPVPHRSWIFVQPAVVLPRCSSSESARIGALMKKPSSTDLVWCLWDSHQDSTALEVALEKRNVYAILAVPSVPDRVLVVEVDAEGRTVVSLCLPDLAKMFWSHSMSQPHAAGTIVHVQLEDGSDGDAVVLSVVYRRADSDSVYSWRSMRFTDGMANLEEITEPCALPGSISAQSAPQCSISDGKLAIYNPSQNAVLVIEGSTERCRFAMPARISNPPSLVWITEDYLAVGFLPSNEQVVHLRILNVAFQYAQKEMQISTFSAPAQGALDLAVVSSDPLNLTMGAYLTVTVGNQLAILPLAYREPTLLDSLKHAAASSQTPEMESFSTENALLRLLESASTSVQQWEDAFAQADLVDGCDPWITLFASRVFHNANAPSSFWPRKSLAALMQDYHLSARHCSGAKSGSLMNGLLLQQDWELLAIALCHIQDFSERDIVHGLQYVLSKVPESELAQDLDARNAVHTCSSSMDLFRFPLDRSGLPANWRYGHETASEYWARMLLSYPGSDTMYTRALKALSVEEVGRVLTFLQKWFRWYQQCGKPFVRQQVERATVAMGGNAKEVIKIMSLADVTSTLSYLTDAHLSTILLTRSLHATFLSLAECVRSEVRSCEEMEPVHSMLRDTYRVTTDKKPSRMPQPTTHSSKPGEKGTKNKRNRRHLFITKKPTVADRQASQALSSYGIERVQWW